MGYSKSNYEFLKSRGICTKCGKNKAVNKTTYCEYCLEKDVIKNAIWINRQIKSLIVFKKGVLNYDKNIYVSC